MIGLLALASLALSAVSDGEKEPVDLQRAMALAKYLNQPEILAEAIVAQGFAREREIVLRLAKKLETSPPDVRAFLEGVLKACREQKVERVFQIEKGARSVAFSPDGKTLAMSLLNQTIQNLDVASGNTLWKFHHKAVVISGVAFAPDGKTLAIGSYQTEALLFDATSGRVLGSLTPKDTILSVAFSPDGQTIAMGSTDGKVKIVNASSRKTLWEIPCEGFVFSVAFAPDGRTLATGSSDCKTRIFDLESRTVLQEIKHGGFVYSVDFSPDGKTIAAGLRTRSEHGISKIIDVASGAVLQEIPQESWALCTVFFNDGKTLLTGSHQGIVKIVDTASGRVLREWAATNGNGVQSMALAPDEKTLVTASFSLDFWRMP
jgi:WD40 repeat protein